MKRMIVRLRRWYLRRVLGKRELSTQERFQKLNEMFGETQTIYGAICSVDDNEVLRS